MTMAAPPEAPEGERLARLEAAVDFLIREVGDIKADGRDMRAEMRDMRTAMNRHLLIIMGAMISMWLTVVLAILAILLRM